MKSRINVSKLLGEPVSESEKFHVKTKNKKLDRKIDKKYWPEEWIKKLYKSYFRLEEINLDNPTRTNFTLQQALKSRRSVRNFSSKPISLGKISNLIYYSAGLSDKNSHLHRFYPSAGGRFPLEVYVISLNSKLPKGIYHYYVKNNSLERVGPFPKGDLAKITSEKWTQKAGLIIVITAVFQRNTVKYGDRGYRHVLVEAGHLAQNFYLNCQSQKLGVCSVGSYVDDLINEKLDIDGNIETIVYMLGVGEI